MKKIFKISTAMLAITTISAPIAIVVSCGSTTEEITDPKRAIENAEKLVTFSKNKKNVVLFWADEVTGAVVYDWLKNQTEGKKIAKELTGATVYKDVMVPGISTNQGVPVMYGGWDFTIPEKDYGKYQKDTIETFNKKAHKTMVDIFKDKNYQQQYHQLQWFGHENYEGKNQRFYTSNSTEFENYIKDPNVTATSTHELLYKYKPSNLTQKQISEDSAKVDQYGVEQWVENLKVVKTEKPIFKSFNTQATHGPYWYRNSKGELVKGDSDKTAYGIIKELSKMIKQLKKQGIYDNTMIVFASDHGSNRVPTDIYNPEWSMFNDWQKNKVDSVFWQPFRMNPTLIIKPFNKKGALKYDESTFLSNADIPQIFSNAIGSNFLEKQTNSKFFLKDPLNQTKPRSLEMWGSDWHYKPKDRTFLGIHNQKHKITNNYWNLNNWETADYRKNNWSKTLSIIISKEQLAAWNDFPAAWDKFFDGQRNRIGVMSKTSRLLEPMMLKFVDEWKNRAKAANINFNVSLRLNYDNPETGYVGQDYILDTLDDLSKWITNNQSSPLLGLFSPKEMTMFNFRVEAKNQVLDEAWLKLWHKLREEFGREITNQGGDDSKAARIVEQKILKLFTLWEQKSQTANLAFEPHVRHNFDNPALGTSGTDWILDTIDDLGDFIDYEKRSKLFNILQPSDLEVSKYF